MRKWIRNSALAMSMAAMTLLPSEDMNAQHGPRSTESVLERQIQQEYWKTVQTIGEGESLSDIEGLRTESKEALEWLIDAYNTPLTAGDEVSFIETESSDGVSYPFSVRLDYSSPENEDLLFVGEKTDLGYAIKVDYYDSDARHRRSLWINKRNQSLYDIGMYELDFPIEGFFEDHQRRISSGYGPRTNPLTGAYGGPDMNFHDGIDIPLRIGTPIIAPADGEIRIGYTSRPEGTGGYRTFKHLGRILTFYTDRYVRNSSRRLENHRIQLRFYHLSDYPEDIRREAAERRTERVSLAEGREEEFIDWYDWILSSPDERRVFQNLQVHGIYSLLFPNISVKKGDIIGYTGNTGMSTGPHAHIGLRVNHSSTDPEEYYGLHGVRRGLSQSEADDMFDKYENIRDILSE